MTKKKWNTDNIGDQSGRLVVITGATSGIGKQTAKILAAKNATVIIGARNLAKAEVVIDEIKNQYPNAAVFVRSLDLASLDSVEAFAHSITQDFDKLDVLINNAGIMACPYSETQDGFEIQLGTNHLGHFALTGRLLPLLLNTESSRLVVLSSMAHAFGKLNLADINWTKRKYNTNRAYADSKQANLYFMYELIERLKDQPNAPTISAAHPGWTRTELQRHVGVINYLNRFFAQDVDQGALPTLRAGFDSNVDTGDFYGPADFFEMHGEPVKVKPRKLSPNKETGKTLWQQSEALTGVCY